MNIYRKQRNWSQYNQKLKSIARVDFFITDDVLAHWHYCGVRKPGGKVVYRDEVIELCLLMREFYHLAYRQTQGFVESIFQFMGLDLPIPDYTTLSRRAATLEVSLRNHHIPRTSKDHLVVAIDSTGLSIYSSSQWGRIRYQRQTLYGHEQWRKLHVAMDVQTGEILNCQYTPSNHHDGLEGPRLLDAIDEPIAAVCGDMAYDTVNCRRAIQARGARQLIPPIRKARLSKDNRNMKKYQHILQERDDAIAYINNKAIDGNKTTARSLWKQQNGYHARSLVETTMWQIKAHCSDQLKNKREDTRQTQATIKCKVVNLITAA